MEAEKGQKGKVSLSGIERAGFQWAGVRGERNVRESLFYCTFSIILRNSGGKGTLCYFSI